MEKISEIIKRLCPEGVEKVRLGQIIEYEQPSKYIVKNTDYKESGIPVLTAGQSFILGYTDELTGIFHATKSKPTIIFDDFTTSFHWVDFDFKVKSSAMKMLNVTRNDVSFRYVYYAMREIVYEPVEHSRQWISQYSNFEIPLPPLSIQQEIVRVLDSFTAMITNLETELASRQKQYEYYRNELLTFDENAEGVEWKTLGEIGTMFKGKGIQKADFVDEGMPCIHYGQVHTYYGFSATETKSFVSEEMYSNSKKAKKGDIIIATTSEDIEACCKSTVWLGDTEPAISGDAHYFRHSQNPKYIGYLFMTEMFAAQKRTAAVGAKVTRVHGDSILKFKFPIPSIQHQNEVVEKLDNFEVLISNIKQEIAARKKQYEYYREKLLTFE